MSLKSYLKDLSQSDDLLKFKSVVTIFRCVLPHLSSMQSQLLLDVQLDLMKAGPKVVRLEDLEEVMSCLRSIDGVIHNTAKLVAFAILILQHVLRPPSRTGSGEAVKGKSKGGDSPRKRDARQDVAVGRDHHEIYRL